MFDKAIYNIRCALSLLSLCVCLSVTAQNISVQSFRLLEGDMTANTAGSAELDQNGEKAALIKVVTTQTGFQFDCGSLGVVKTVQKTGEIWVYVPRGVRRMTVAHPTLGLLRDYNFPVGIEGARTYEMVLTTAHLQTVVQQDVGGQYLVLTVTPADVIVQIDDAEVQLTNGGLSKLLSYGSHTYRVSSPLYQTENGVIEMGSEKQTLAISLKPAYGILDISTTPENGARVYIDNDAEVSGTTPFTSKKLAQGSHTLRIQQAQYDSRTMKVDVKGDGTTQKVTVPMTANFGTVNISAPEGSHIYVNNEDKGIGRWNGRLSEGLYAVEARKDSHRPYVTSINVVKGESLDVALNAPTPIYGTLNVSSEPFGADVYIDGQKVGATPDIFKNVLAGSRTVELRKKGYDDYKTQVSVEEGKITEANATMSEARQNVAQNTVPVGGGTSVSNARYVDLGLSVKWATCNLGASSPEEYGNYYAWAETKPRTGSSWYYDWKTAPYYLSGDSYENVKWSKYTGSDGKTVLDPADDAATVALGSPWRMPTLDEIKELKDKCTWTWTTMNGKNGYKVVGPNGNSIFLPAAGCRDGSSLNGAGASGDYWASLLNATRPNGAYDLYFYSGNYDWYYYRFIGQSVRPVRP